MDLSTGINCGGDNNSDFMAVVNSLNSKNIPVVAATGNKNSSTGVLGTGLQLFTQEVYVGI